MYQLLLCAGIKLFAVAFKETEFSYRSHYQDCTTAKVILGTAIVYLEVNTYKALRVFGVIELKCQV